MEKPETLLAATVPAGLRADHHGGMKRGLGKDRDGIKMVNVFRCAPISLGEKLIRSAVPSCLDVLRELEAEKFFHSRTRPAEQGKNNHFADAVSFYAPWSHQPKRRVIAVANSWQGSVSNRAVHAARDR